MSTRMPPEAPRYKLAQPVFLFFVSGGQRQRPAPNNRDPSSDPSQPECGGFYRSELFRKGNFECQGLQPQERQGGMQPMSPRMLPGGSEAPPPCPLTPTPLGGLGPMRTLRIAHAHSKLHRPLAPSLVRPPSGRRKHEEHMLLYTTRFNINEARHMKHILRPNQQTIKRMLR